MLLGSRTLVSIVGWWLERKQSALGIKDADFSRLRTFLPQSKHYGLGARPGDAALVEKWRVLLPKHVVNSNFEGL